MIGIYTPLLSVPTKQLFQVEVEHDVSKYILTCSNLDLKPLFRLSEFGGNLFSKQMFLKAFLSCLSRVHVSWSMQE